MFKKRIFFAAVLLSCVFSSVFTGCKKSNPMAGYEFISVNLLSAEDGIFTDQIFFNKDGTVTIQECFENDKNDIFAWFGEYEISDKYITFKIDAFEEIKDDKIVTDPKYASELKSMFNTYFNYSYDSKEETLKFLDDEGKEITRFTGFKRKGLTGK